MGAPQPAGAPIPAIAREKDLLQQGLLSKLCDRKE